MSDEDFDAEAALDGKLAQLLAIGFDPGAATGPTTYSGAGAWRGHEFATLCAHPRFGAHEVHGLIGAHYLDTLGGPAGSWGFPLSDEYPDGAGRTSDFEGGSLYWTAEDGVLEIYATPGQPIPPEVDWTTVGGSQRLAYAVRVLVDNYGYPANGAAGIVGNLWAESGVLPSRIEGSAASTPMRAKGFDDRTHDFSAADIMNRDRAARTGPALPGVGLAQWTSGARRAGLFTHAYNGTVLGPDVLSSMDAQLDYLSGELAGSYPGVHAVVADPAVSVPDACDDVVYRFEVPGAILDGGTKLPRDDPRVQAVFQQRRSFADRALREYRLEG
ncbi:phage tail tip lysozyme [Actinophytocola sp.]|uniref:phage tail tip lysozyme n=1 Tax=Actinophytocola sp. TaxID=1872138 RepID=UPI002D80D221|nr:phage tail tip lysozyme [Actinophytocola sp.]HET9143111.1 phage tail tip lysozyme [Actinophytocola sp.]